MMTEQIQSAAIILAAGKGTRMKSAKPKSLHEVAGLPMIGHAIKSAQAALDKESNPVAVVISPAQAEDTEHNMQAVIKQFAPHAHIAIQAEPLGSADAVRAALPSLPASVKRILIMFGDTPLIRPPVLAELLATPSSLAVLGFTPDDPTGYGRIVLANDKSAEQGKSADTEKPVQIVEHKDTDATTRKIKLCNGGAMAIDADILPALIDGLSNANAQGEYCLPGIVELAAAQGHSIALVMGTYEDAMGADSRAGLARAEAIMQARLRAGFLAAGVTMLAPETVHFSYDTIIGQDVRIEPYCFFGTQTRIGSGTIIKSFSHIEGAEIGENATIGPYARLRPGTKLADHVRIGNFVETKQVQVAAGAKINHLSYIGDARIGTNANIGAGTITCNYDGFAKHITEIGDGVFIGSNSALIAPITIGAGAYLGSGSILGEDVKADALALTRAPVKQIEGWAARFRAKHDKE